MPIPLQFPLPLSDATRAKAMFLFCRAYVEGDHVCANQIFALSRQDAELEAMLRGHKEDALADEPHTQNTSE